MAALRWLVVGAIAACGPSKPPPEDTSCPTAEPKHDASCNFDGAKVCSYTIETVRDVHCHCTGSAWSCEVPLGIDVPATDRHACPPEPPKGECTLKEVGAQGYRPGCLYKVRATPWVNDCVCAHFPSEHAAQWDCAQRAGNAAIDVRGCPGRQPVPGSECAAPTKEPCQYGPNLSTTCECVEVAGGASMRTWRCNTVKQPPFPGAP
jgi:hypothetical protein